MIKNKKGLELEMLGWWILALAVLVVMIIGFMILKNKDVSAVNFIKNLFRFGK